MSFESAHSLTKADINRYSRQILVEEFGPSGQSGLKSASVLIVGAGGLGCPLATCLAGAGIGRLGIVDYDHVELSNLHRQTSHLERSVGQSKSDSLVSSVQMQNSTVECTSHRCLLTSSNAMEIISAYDIVADCSDNVPTRYLLNDACILARKPLVSGSALRWEGQLTVYGNGGDCPCYRCIFTEPPPAAAVTNCSEGGVMGSVTMAIGAMQANEIMKILAGLPSSFAGRLLLLDALSGTSRSVKLRGRDRHCAVCGDSPSIQQLLPDYEAYCGLTACDAAATVDLLPADDRISVTQLSEMLQISPEKVSLIDVRTKNEFDACHLPGAINMEFVGDGSDITPSSLERLADEVVVVCHRGNDSQLAVVRLRQALHAGRRRRVRDVVGGLDAWARLVDPAFPTY